MNQNNTNIPAAIGAPLAGGFFFGIINVGPDQFALIVAPKAQGTVKGAWNGSDKSIAGAASYNDGFENTIAMAEGGSELAQEVRALTIDSHSDWYIPSRDELELMYRNLKPLTDDNLESFRDGDNPSSVPVGYPYTATLPAQTAADAFKEGGAEALDAVFHWSSTQYAAYPSDAWGQNFDDGNQDGNRKSYAGRARAVRRLAIQ